MVIANILFGFTSLLALVLALFVFIANPRKGVNRSLAALLLSIFLWLVTNLATNLSADPRLALFFARMTLIGPLFFTFFFMIFTEIFQSTKKYTNKKMLIEMVPILALVPLMPTSLNIKSIGPYGAETVVGPLYTPATILAVIYMIRAVVKLYLKYSKAPTAAARMQVKYIFIGILGAFIPSLITNAILPVFVESDSFLYGPNSVIILAVFMTIAIVKHRLLDIRLIVARSITYVLLFAAVLVIYGIVILGIGEFVLPETKVTVIERIFYIAFALVVAISYQPLKRYFDRITNKYFFQDAYETQSVIRNVSNVVVGSIDPHKIQRGALEAISSALKPTYMTFVLLGVSNGLRQGDIVGRQWGMHNPEVLQEVLKRVGKKIVLYDELEEKTSTLRDVLRVEDISVAAPLVTKDEHIGYLILGPKKSGNIYNSQDVGLLNIASNELAVALQNAQRFEEIQAFNITLQEKVTEATREVKKTNRKLVALDEAKDEFISMASHQLRTPLTSIKGYLSMMVEGDLGKVNAAQEKALKEAFGSSQRMVYLIADFLNVSRIKTGKFVIETKEVDLPEVVGEEITQLREMAASRDITLQYEAPGVFPRVKLDDNKIRQVMMNMVDNAIYYTPSGGTVTIQLYVDAKDVVFKVVDTGIGVPKREQHKLFTKFFRAGNARKARPDGTGLGLFMAQKIIVEQGGSIIFESTEGKGSTFGFRFPLAAIKI